ncbi:hypothetical protein [Streptomyces fungicidicus]|uniref:hypothetical protein n=1 Tax=Streptomyces fungicidicus TaxID=68203 RepID=UPI0013CE9BFC|nr:hypothetical protein [Streptomyces fungicidicus]
MRPSQASAVRSVIVAVGAHDRAAGIVDAAARLARDADSPPEVVHVRRTAGVEEQAVDTESDEQARADSTRRWPARPSRGTPGGRVAGVSRGRLRNAHSHCGGG